MALWQEEKYLRLLSPQLALFKQKHPHLYNFRCPLCGDSERVKSKTRGYCYATKDTLMFKCHNCSVALPFAALLKRVSRHLYDEFVMEKLKSERPPVEAPKDAPDTLVVAPQHANEFQQYVAPLSRLVPQNPLYPVREYVLQRGVPETELSRLYATRCAKAWLSPLVDVQKVEKVADGLNYLVFPLLLPDGRWYGAQLRPVPRKEFITYRWSHYPMKVFGLDRWDAKQTTYVVEGAFDSLLVPNAIAACGSDLFNAVQSMEAHDLLKSETPRVYVWDNEPRNKEICSHIRAAIALKESVVIWPSHYPKDINEMSNAGLDFLKMIAQRTFKGLQAELEFAAWKK